MVNWSPLKSPPRPEVSIIFQARDNLFLSIPPGSVPERFRVYFPGALSTGHRPVFSGLQSRSTLIRKSPLFSATGWLNRPDFMVHLSSRLDDPIANRGTQTFHRSAALTRVSQRDIRHTDRPLRRAPPLPPAAAVGVRHCRLGTVRQRPLNDQHHPLTT